MEYRHLGRSGLQVSAIGLGTNNLGIRVPDPKAAADIIRQAVDLGITFIDTSNMYGDGRSEEFIGEAIKGMRDRVILATKVSGTVGEGPNQRGASRHHIMTEVENSLKALQTDYIDLYQIHFYDARTPAEETMRALDELVRQGKVRYIGASNYLAWHLCEAIWTARLLHLEEFVSFQFQWSLVHREPERELVPFSRAYGLGIIPYFPLASGLLTGKYRRGQAVPEDTRFAINQRLRQRFLTERNFDLLERLERFAQEHGHTTGELAIAWLLAQPQVSSVIVGATRPEQVVENAKAAEWRLTQEELQEVDRLLGPVD
ncbi:MAG: aldo/keto reductase [Chloroflexi bacterium]|nr:aldo/keto reductase [Chloroflexota bacterium]